MHFLFKTVLHCGRSQTRGSVMKKKGGKLQKDTHTSTKKPSKHSGKKRPCLGFLIFCWLFWASVHRAAGTLVWFYAKPPQNANVQQCNIVVVPATWNVGEGCHDKTKNVNEDARHRARTLYGQLCAVILERKYISYHAHHVGNKYRDIQSGLLLHTFAAARSRRDNIWLTSLSLSVMMLPPAEDNSSPLRKIPYSNQITGRSSAKG